MTRLNRSTSIRLLFVGLSIGSLIGVIGCKQEAKIPQSELPGAKKTMTAGAGGRRPNWGGGSSGAPVNLPPPPSAPKPD